MILIPCHNERTKLTRVLTRLSRAATGLPVCVIDDGSTDGSAEAARHLGAEVVRHETRRGVGEALRSGFRAARAAGDVVVVIAGNDKDEPEQIPRLLEPIRANRADFVRGSRFLPGGKFGGPMPRYRVVGIRALARFASAGSRVRVTDATNGFCAFRRSLLDDPRIRARLALDRDATANADWLSGYSLEPYFWLQAMELGYDVIEVPVTKIYPPKTEGYTKMKPLAGWWQLARPVLSVAWERFWPVASAPRDACDSEKNRQNR